MNPKYPLYIVSKGRWKSRLTSKALEKMNVPYHIVVEKKEYKKYARVIDKNKIIILDPYYQEIYETCDELNFTKGKGAGAARNFVWQHSIDLGYDWHWVIDDNITDFYRLNRNIKWRAYTGAIFRAMEDFCERYENVFMAGPQYEMFVPRKTEVPPFVPNTRIYSCNLIRNDIPFKWRGRYNEDTILSLDILKAGYCTIQFNAFLQDKKPTQTMKGGNTDELYKDGTLEKSQMLVNEHPDVSKLVWKFGRWHHYVDYSKFQHPIRGNKLKRKKGLKIPKGVNEYNMKLITLEEEDYEDQ